MSETETETYADHPEEWTEWEHDCEPWCDGTGYRVVCFDDLCRGAGRCMHGGDGMEYCSCYDGSSW